MILKFVIPIFVSSVIVSSAIPDPNLEMEQAVNIKKEGYVKRIRNLHGEERAQKFIYFKGDKLGGKFNFYLYFLKYF